MFSRTRLTLAAVATAVCVGTVAAPAAAANAAAAASTITCVAPVQNVHGSTHVTGTINVVATVQCTAFVLSIAQQAALYKIGGSSWWGKKLSDSGAVTIQTNAATSCSQAPGQFYGVAVTTIVFPPGYVPTTPTARNTYGATSGVTCSTAQIAPALPNELSSASGMTAVFSATKTQ